MAAACPQQPDRVKRGAASHSCRERRRPGRCPRCNQRHSQCFQLYLGPTATGSGVGVGRVSREAKYSCCVSIRGFIWSTPPTNSQLHFFV
eukprot:4810402-Prymnesium_polylepis.1